MKKINLMEVCGTHTMAIARSGLKKLLPKGVELISGPGCPVCVTPQEDIDRAVKIARREDVIMTTFGDMMRVPGASGSLEDAARDGADVRVVFSPMDSLETAEKHPGKKVVFMGVGFETTSPTVAATVIEARKRKLKNYFVIPGFKLLFPALELLAGSEKLKIDGFICPGHVSVITGSVPYREVADRYRVPCVITGFEDADILKGISRLLRQISAGKSEVEIEYRRAVTEKGNPRARRLLDEVFRPADSAWRGLGNIRSSGLRFRKEYSSFDAGKAFKVKVPRASLPKGCLCGDVLQGYRSPKDCKLFTKKCTPENPIGPCMVSSEGACAAVYKYG